MDNENKPVNFFYDSDEDVSWGPITLREVKRDLKSKKKLEPEYRRQTSAFVPLNLSQSSKEYYTANETQESNNTGTTSEEPENASVNISHVNSSKMSSDNFLSVDSEPTENFEVVAISDSEDDEIPKSIHIKKERISANPDSKTCSVSIGDNSIICLSSSEDEDEHNSKIISRSFSYQEESINSGDDEEEEARPENVFKSVSEMWEHEDEAIKQNILNISSNHDSGIKNEKLRTPNSQLKIPKINIISVTPIKRSNYFSMNVIDQDTSSAEKDEVVEEKSCHASSKSLSSNECEQCMEGVQKNSEEKDNISTYNNKDNSLSNTSTQDPVNNSQKENEYDYYEQQNHTISKLDSENSYKNSNVCDISQDLSINADEIYQNDSVSGISEDLGNFSLNDTFAEMERLLTNGFDSDSDDSSDGVIESTPCKISRPPVGNTSANSKIPIPTTFSDESSCSSTSMRNDFKVPKFPAKVIKKTPVNNKILAPKSSPLPLKNIVSPVRLYIKNSPFPALKQSHKPGCTRSQHTLEGISEGTVARKKHRNLLDSLPEVVYKPSKLVEKKCENQIILPSNIRSLITERIVIKHEPRKRINLNESMFSMEEKLKMRDISHIVSDDHNMSIHTIKNGFNL